MKNIWMMILLLAGSVSAQPPSVDANWDLIWTDNFNSTPASPDWYVVNNSHRAGEPTVYMADNVTASSGIAHLAVEQETQLNGGITYNYTAAEINTVTKYLYGYFETRVKYPASNKLWPAFWLQWGATAGGNYTEIDIFENDGGKPYYVSSNYHYQTAANILANNLTSDPFLNYNFPENTTGSYHTWGLEWTPTQQIIYYDGREIRRTNHTAFIQAMPVKLDMTLYSGSPGSATFPQYFDVDYVKVYKMKKSNVSCSSLSDATISTFSGYTYDLKKNITISNNVSVPSSTNVILRATSGITIGNNFTVPLGSEFGAVITICH